MPNLFEAAAGVSNQWSLAAFAIAAILYFILRRRGKVPGIAWACIAAIVVIGLAPILASAYLERARLTGQAIYRVRITVLDLEQTPVEDAKVWSSAGGEAKKVAGGWQFDIPAASLPAGGKLTVYAAQPNAFLKGSQDLQLAEDRNPAVVLALQQDRSAMVRGLVVDGAGRALEGARVGVAGYESEAVTTQAGGNFALPAHRATGQQVQLHAEKKGYAAASQFHPAGDEPATIVLERK